MAYFDEKRFITGIVLLLIGSSLIFYTVFPTNLGGGGGLDITPFCQKTNLGNCGYVQTSNEPSFQSSVTQCTMSGTIEGGNGCLSTITFPKAFKSVPTTYGINVYCIVNVLQNLAGQTSASTVCTNAASQGHIITGSYPFVTINLVTSNGTRWRGFPAAATPLFGADTNSVGLPLTNLPNGVSYSLSVTCEGSSSSSTAFLGVQVSSDFATWFEFDSTNRYTDVNSGGFCSIATPTSPLNTSTNVGIPKKIGTNFCGGVSCSYIRVFGQNGAGAADTGLIISEVQITLYTSSPNVPTAYIGTGSATGTGMTTTSMPFWVSENTQLNFGAIVPVMQWWACTC